jgi:Flp pilus assembly pilin Flp
LNAEPEDILIAQTGIIGSPMPMEKIEDGVPRLKRLIVEEQAQGMTEYALILGLIVLGVWVAVGATDLGNKISTLFGGVANTVSSCTTGNCP